VHFSREEAEREREGALRSEINRRRGEDGIMSDGPLVSRTIKDDQVESNGEGDR
jgi:hypothetical protein